MARSSSPATCWHRTCATDGATPAASCIAPPTVAGRGSPSALSPRASDPRRTTTSRATCCAWPMARCLSARTTQTAAPISSGARPTTAGPGTRRKVSSQGLPQPLRLLRRRDVAVAGQVGQDLGAGARRQQRVSHAGTGRSRPRTTRPTTSFSGSPRRRRRPSTASATSATTAKCTCRCCVCRTGGCC